MKNILAVLIVLFVFTTTPTLALVVAEEAAVPAPLPDPVTTSGVTYEQLRSDYLFQIEKNRQAKDRFELDKAEFNKLKTLASREKSVTSMRPYLESRAWVLITYLSALEFLLKDANGIDVTDRTNTLNRINAARSYLLTFVDTIPTLVDRDTINAASEKFEQDVALVFEAQYRTLALLATGRVQSAYDQLDIATQEFLDVYVEAIPEEGKKAVILRGMMDVTSANEKAEMSLTEARDSFEVFIPVNEILEKKTKPSYKSMHNSMRNKLQTAFASMKQSITFLIELEGQI